MSAFYHFQHQHHPTAALPSVPHGHHGGRSKRTPRLSMSQNNGGHKQFRGVRSMKDLTETAALTTFRIKYEAGRSFDLEDDMEFCPGLLTDSDLISIHSSSERSSLASNSPESSPTQQPTQVAPLLSLNSTSPAFMPPSYPTHHHQQQHHHHIQQQHTLKLHQPAATRVRNAIPIINPATGISMSSPPPSVSPARMQQTNFKRW